MKMIYKHIPRTAGTSLKEILPDGTFILGHNYYDEGYKHLYHHRIPFMKRFVFSFVRNPYDRVVSAFHYLNAGGNNPKDEIVRDIYLSQYNGDFDYFVEYGFPKVLDQIHFMPQYSWIFYNYINICNYVGKFETINEDIKELSKFIDFKSDSLPDINKSEHKHYKDYYTVATKKIIYEYYRTDFELFGYEE